MLIGILLLAATGIMWAGLAFVIAETSRKIRY